MRARKTEDDGGAKSIEKRETTSPFLQKGSFGDMRAIYVTKEKAFNKGR